MNKELDRIQIKGVIRRRKKSFILIEFWYIYICLNMVRNLLLLLSKNKAGSTTGHMNVSP